MPTAEQGCGVVTEKPNSGGSVITSTAQPTFPGLDEAKAIKAYDNYFYFAYGDRSKVMTLQPDAGNFRLQCLLDKDCNDASGKICCAKVNIKDTKSKGELSINRCVSKDHDGGKVNKKGGS